MLFNEATLEAAIMELLADEGYSHYTGDSIHRENTEVLLVDDIKMYLLDKYSQDDITVTEVNSIILMLRSVSGFFMKPTNPLWIW